jgi:hypothetical protein
MSNEEIKLIVIEAPVKNQAELKEFLHNLEVIFELLI